MKRISLEKMSEYILQTLWWLLAKHISMKILVQNRSVMKIIWFVSNKWWMIIETVQIKAKFLEYKLFWFHFRKSNISFKSAEIIYIVVILFIFTAADSHKSEWWRRHHIISKNVNKSVWIQNKNFLHNFLLFSP